MSDGEYMTAAVGQYASAHGADAPDSAWILSPFDTWEKNPHYKGPKQPHPEDAIGMTAEEYDELLAEYEAEAETQAEARALPPPPAPFVQGVMADDDLPF